MSCKFKNTGDDSEAFGSGANDIVVVQQSDGSLKSTAITVQVTFLDLKNLGFAGTSMHFGPIFFQSYRLQFDFFREIVIKSHHL